jgi:hypothetical protein
MGELRNWFVFDLGAISPRPVVTASLVLDARFWFTDTGSETYRVTSFSGSSTALMNGSGGTTAFAGLGTGTTYAEFTRTGFLGNTVSIDLNAAFLSDIPFNNKLVIGGRLTTLSPLGTMFGSSSTAEGGFRPELVLDDGMPVAPLPPAWMLGMTGLLCGTALRLAKRHRRQTSLSDIAVSEAMNLPPVMD